MLSHVVANVVWTENDASLASANVILFNVLDSCPHSCTGGSSAHESLFTHKSTGHQVRLFIRSLHPLIDKSPIADSWDEVVADTFDLLASFMRRVGIIQTLGLS